MSKTTPCFDTDCNQHKQRYDQCFNKWYSEIFLNTKPSASSKDNNNNNNNNSSSNVNGTICEFEWNKYHTCLMKSINNSNNNALKESIEKAQKEIEEHPPFFEESDKK